MGKKTQISVALLSISLGIFIVTSVLAVSCANNKNNPSEEWRKMGDDYCIYVQNVNQFLTNFVEFIRNNFT